MGSLLKAFCLISFVNLVYQCLSVAGDAQSGDDGPYRGKFIGKLNTYHHQVSGDVYAVDEYTFLFVGFNYDGNGADTFFWSGAANRPGPQGFIVPDEYGNTNILERYFNKDFTLRLPDNKKLTDVQWISIYDLNTQNNFGDVFIADDFEAPIVQKIGGFERTRYGVESDPVEILDSKTIRIPEFSFSGHGIQTHFLVGTGPQPSKKGHKIPDELGYLDPIRRYDHQTINLTLPGDLTIFDIDWLAIYDLERNEHYGFVIITDGLNVPPSLAAIKPLKNALPNCKQLHKDLRVSWEVFGPTITFELSGQVDEDNYMAFGLSGSPERSQMLGADVAIAYIDGYRGYSVDYNITSLAPCVQVLGQNKGVCRDDVVGGYDSFQLHTFQREDGVNTITFRRNLISADSGDKEYELDRELYVVWAVGRLDLNKEPAFHDLYPKRDIKIHFNTTEPYNDCFSFAARNAEKWDAWERPQIYDKAIRSFIATLGPAGGKRGYQGITGHVSNGLAWYINGYLIPEIWVRRGLTYSFKVYGGNNPHSPEYYHPMVITDEPRGGYDRLSDVKQSEIRVLAGVEFTRRGRPKPTAAGTLCLSSHADGFDRRLDDTYILFRKYNRTLRSHCDGGDPAILEISPNNSWPDTVYYNSFTHSNMGWKIHVIDSYATNSLVSSRISSFLFCSSLITSFFVI